MPTDRWMWVHASGHPELDDVETREASMCNVYARPDAVGFAPIEPDLTARTIGALRQPPLNFHKTVAHEPRLLEMFVTGSEFMQRPASKFPRALRELAYIRVSQLNDCGY